MKISFSRFILSCDENKMPEDAMTFHLQGLVGYKMGEEDNSPKILVKKFYALQEERVQTYNLFEDGFTAYLKGAPNYNFPMYRNLVNEITKAFQGVSQEIICIEKKLTESYQLHMVSSLIRKIQEVEKKKLEVTAQLQIARQNEIDQPTSDCSEEVQELKQKIVESVESINELMEELKYECEDLYNTDNGAEEDG